MGGSKLKKILIAEDDADINAVLCDALKKLGIYVYRIY